MNSMLLAAGVGQRFRPHTDKLAKPAIPFMNLPLLSYSLFLLETLKPGRLIINTHHLSETVRSAANSVIMDAKYKLTFSDEQPVILDSAGGMGRVRHDLRGEGDFVVANADTILLLRDTANIVDFFEAHKEADALATIFAVPHLERTKKFGGLWVNEEGQIRSIGSIPVKGCKVYMYPGFMALRDDVFLRIPQSEPSHIFKDILLPAIADGETVNAFIDDEALWYETGDEKSYLQATDLLLQIMSDQSSRHRNFIFLLQKRFQMNLVQLTASAWAESGAQVNAVLETGLKLLVGANSTIEEGAKLHGFCVVGPNQFIPSGCEIKNSVILNSKDLNKNTIIHDKLVI